MKKKPTKRDLLALIEAAESKLVRYTASKRDGSPPLLELIDLLELDCRSEYDQRVAAEGRLAAVRRSLDSGAAPALMSEREASLSFWSVQGAPTVGEPAHAVAREQHERTLEAVRAAVLGAAGDGD